MSDSDSLAELCCDLVETCDGNAIAEIEPEHLLMLGVDEGTLLLDVREAHERVESGYIPGDTHIPLDDVEKHAEMTLFGHLPTQQDLAMPVICYCRSGRRSITAATTLRNLGFANPLSLAGGIIRFASMGGPIEKPEG
ncbi:MAG: rhodanese-like domain-containing protein [Phycisphaerales bacterium JB043]